MTKDYLMSEIPQTDSSPTVGSLNEIEEINERITMNNFLFPPPL